MLRTLACHNVVVVVPRIWLWGFTSTDVFRESVYMVMETKATRTVRCVSCAVYQTTVSEGLRACDNGYIKADVSHHLVETKRGAKVSFWFGGRAR